MRRFLAAVPALIGLSWASTATAADLSLAPLYKSPPPASWTGFYIGGQAGGGWAHYDDLRVSPGSPAFPPGFPSSGNLSGGLAGGQIGADYQVGRFVFGVTGDADWARLTGTNTSIGVTGETATRNSTVSSLFDVGGRIGYAWNSLLPYVKGGAAWERFSDSTISITPGGAFTSASSGADTRSGWFIGGGAEYKFTPNASLFAEYDHYGFGSTNVTRTITAAGPGSPLPVGAPITSSSSTHTDVLKVGVNWRPDWTLSLP